MKQEKITVYLGIFKDTQLQEQILHDVVLPKKLLCAIDEICGKLIKHLNIYNPLPEGFYYAFDYRERTKPNKKGGR